MPYEAYQIGISFVSDATRAVGVTDALVGGLERLIAAEARAQSGLIALVQALRGAGRVANTLADAMERVEAAAEAAARASARIKSPAISAAANAPGGAGPVMAAATRAAGGQRLLGYTPTPPGQGFVLVGPSRGPGTGIVPVGPATGGGGASFANVGGSAGALAPAGAGGGGGMTPGNRFTLPPGSGSPPPGTGAPIPLNLRNPRTLPALGPYGKMMAGYLGYKMVRSGFEAGADVDDTLAKMAAMHVMGSDGQPTAAFTPAQIKAAQDQAMATMRKTPGLGYNEALNVTLQTAGLLGSSDKAMQLSPQLSFNAQVLSRYGKGDAIAQIEKGVQAGELTGLTGKDGKIDVPRLLDFVNRLTRTTVAMGGQLDIGKYLTGIRQFGLGAESADLDFTTAVLPAYMKIMGEQKAGTALTSLQQVLLAPVPKTRADRYEKEQKRIGLRDKKGNLINSDGLKSNTQDYFVETLLPTLNAAGFKTPAQITEEIQRLLPRQTVDRLAGAGLMDRALIQKEVDRNLAQQKAGDAPLAKLLQDSPGARVKELSESLRALGAVTSQAAMGPMLDILDRLTKSIQNVTDYVKGHPDDVKRFAEDVDALIQLVLRVGKGIGTIWNYLPAPLKSAVAGATVGGAAGSVIPGVGTAGGAIVGGVAGAVETLNQQMHSSANHLWGLKTPRGYHQTWTGGLEPDAAVQKQSFETGPDTHMQPIQISLMMPNGDVLFRHYDTYAAKRARRPDAGINDFDAIAAPRRPGVPLVTA